MCGIAGIISSDTNLVSPVRIKMMTDSLAHRGPDGQGYWINRDGNAGFGHRRLAIIDLSQNGAQPMGLRPGVSPSSSGNRRRYTITYNGEIYNYREIRDKLRKAGYQFTTVSDTEVILAAYDYWKKNCVLQFDGMFAFAIWDNEENTFFAARDRFGEKPFYFFTDNDQFVFASEMKALWAAGIPKIVDEKMLLNYLALGYTRNVHTRQQTFFKKILLLPPGHYLQINYPNRDLQIQPYWDINKEHTIVISTGSAIEKFTELFTKSVSRRLRSDVNIGTSLSGGLDSSAIAATIDHLLNRNADFKTFSAVFPGFRQDESTHIKTVTGKFKLQNIQTTPTADGLLKDFETLCYYQEEPFDSSSIYAQFKVFELAKQHEVKVLLDGQGADETQAGYNKYIHFYLQQLLSHKNISTVIKEKEKFRKKNIPFEWGAKNYLAALLPSHAALYLERNEYNKTIQQPDINPDFLATTRGREWEGIGKPIIAKLNDILYYNTRVTGLEELLRFADRNSMAHGCEVRLPFLNHELVEFIFSLPAHFKIHNGWTKWLLRSSMNTKLPHETVWRHDKIGFESPQYQWMQNEKLQDYIHESKKKLVSNGILKTTVLAKKILPLTAHAKDNFDWRYLCAAQIL